MLAGGADARRLDAAALGRASGEPRGPRTDPAGDVGAFRLRDSTLPRAVPLPFFAGKFVRESNPGVLPLLCMGGARVGVRSLSRARRPRPTCSPEPGDSDDPRPAPQPRLSPAPVTPAAPTWGESGVSSCSGLPRVLLSLPNLPGGLWLQNLRATAATTEAFQMTYLEQPGGG